MSRSNDATPTRCPGWAVRGQCDFNLGHRGSCDTSGICPRCNKQISIGDYTINVHRTGGGSAADTPVHVACLTNVTNLESGCPRCNGGPQWGHAYDCPTLP
jgi:hypothetical protein